MFDKILEIILKVLPFFGSSKKKKAAMAKEVREFSELVKDQYSFLMEQVEKVLKDYFELSGKVKEMHAEIFSLKEQLGEALALQCKNRDCTQRNKTEDKE